MHHELDAFVCGIFVLGDYFGEVLDYDVEVGMFFDEETGDMAIGTADLY
jgi:hypothetical protein